MKNKFNQKDEHPNTWVFQYYNKQQQGVDELKRAKIDVKISNFLQFLLHLSMWCHFNGM
jgi:hypothetical protein